jgi:hypothetical protein
MSYGVPSVSSSSFEVEEEPKEEDALRPFFESCSS